MKTCKLCESVCRSDVEAALARGVSNRAAAKVLGIGEASVRRHRARHMVSIIDQARALYRRALTLRDPNGALALVREITALLQRLAELSQLAPECRPEEE